MEEKNNSKVEYQEDKLEELVSLIFTELDFPTAVFILTNTLTSAIVYSYYISDIEKKSFKDFEERIDFFLKAVKEALIDKYRKVWEMEL